MGDVCALVHKDFADRLRFARLWRGPATAALALPHGGGGDPLTISKNEPVRDGEGLYVIEGWIRRTARVACTKGTSVWARLDDVGSVRPPVSAP